MCIYMEIHEISVKPKTRFGLLSCMMTRLTRVKHGEGIMEGESLNLEPNHVWDLVDEEEEEESWRRHH